MWPASNERYQAAAPVVAVIVLFLLISLGASTPGRQGPAGGGAATTSIEPAGGDQARAVQQLSTPTRLEAVASPGDRVPSRHGLDAAQAAAVAQAIGGGLVASDVLAMTAGELRDAAGAAGLSIDGVAARAGVHRPALEPGSGSPESGPGLPLLGAGVLLLGGVAAWRRFRRR